MLIASLSLKDWQCPATVNNRSTWNLYNLLWKRGEVTLALKGCHKRRIKCDVPSQTLAQIAAHCRCPVIPEGRVVWSGGRALKKELIFRPNSTPWPLWSSKASDTRYLRLTWGWSVHNEISVSVQPQLDPKGLVWKKGLKITVIIFWSLMFHILDYVKSIIKFNFAWFF